MTDLITFPIRYDPASPMRCPDFWRGCRATRQQVMMQAENDYERSIQAAAISRLEAIMGAVDAGQQLSECDDYRRWLAYELRRPNGLGD